MHLPDIGRQRSGCLGRYRFKTREGISNMDDKQKSKKYFDGHSSTFVNRNGYWNHDYRLTSRILKKRNVKKLIDIGCGNGAFLEMFHKLSPGTKLAGLDLSHEMVLRSRERLPEADITEGDAEGMPFEDGAFDAVSCHMSIHHHPQSGEVCCGDVPDPGEQRNCRDQ